MRQPGNEVRGRRCNDDRVSTARQRDMRHAVIHAAVLIRLPLVDEHGLAGQRLHRGRGDELLRAACHHHLHIRAIVLQAAREFAHLVGRDAAGHAEDDTFAGQFHGAQITSIS